MRGMPVLSLRTLNRTVMQRQFLSEHTTRAPFEVIEHLVALQAQEPNWPYVGLWTRVAGFGHADLTALFEDRRVVRGSLLRTTQHLASGDDYSWVRPAVQPALDRTMQSAYFTRGTGGLDAAKVAEVGGRMLAAEPMVRRQLGKRLGEHFPGVNTAVLAGLVQLRLAVIHPPPNGTWGGWGNRAETPVTLAEAWLGKPLQRKADLPRLVRRYLAAFGPASIADLQAWSGLTRLRGTVVGMRDELRVYRGEGSKELFDLPDAPLADPETPVPPRFLPGYDNLLVGYADRSRVLDEAYRKQVTPGQAVVRPTFLVDGFVQGTWAVVGKAIEISPFRPLSKVDRAALLAEAELLRDFVFENTPGAEITFA